MPAPIRECRQQIILPATIHPRLPALTVLRATSSRFMPMMWRLVVVLLAATAAGALPVLNWSITATALPRVTAMRIIFRAQPVRPLVRLLSIQLHQQHHLSAVKTVPVSAVQQGLAI